ncbi:hypothetical protein [Photobacterium profundum]|nr:hypothetical protein [Photobacterium profundum]
MSIFVIHPDNQSHRECIEAVAFTDRSFTGKTLKLLPLPQSKQK